MEQIIIASHIVKPSSPTPLASKTHKLSFLDQMAPSIYIPHIYLYQNDQSKLQPEEICRRLRQSLSEILTIFYPLAGTIKQNSFVDCDDTGAEFVETRVHGRLAQFIQDPKIEDLMKKLVPVDSSSHNDNLILSVKTSFFDCGGIAVGMCLSHKLGDGSSVVAFMNAWAATCRREASGIIHPSLDLASHFPPRDSHSLPPSVYCLGLTKEKPVTKRLVFDREILEKLRKEAAEWCDKVKNPTRVEAVSVFIWRSFIEANKARRIGTTSFCASHVVNLRPRTPLPDSTFGNCYTYAFAVVSSEEEEDEGLLLSRLSAAIRAVDGDYINRDDKNDVVSVNEEAGDLFETGNCAFTSWWRFPFYDVDFGWGKPVWVGTMQIPYMNGTILMSTPSRDGIEAWINVHDEKFFQFIQANYNKLLTI